MNREALPSSFRDPSGFLYFENGCLYRQINEVYKKDYDHLIASGLYDALVKAKQLIPHEEVPAERSKSVCQHYKTLKPQLVRFISYPYEWCFSQLKDVALTILEIQKTAFNHGMVLKDSSAYNMQFDQGAPILIDTLSFEIYKEGEPWVAYRQFCQHFLAPLALMSYTDLRLNQLFRIYIDGPPLDLVSALLPKRTWINFYLLPHVHVHSRYQRRFSEKGGSPKKVVPNITLKSLFGLMDNLVSAIQSLKFKVSNTEWGDYYNDTNYSSGALAHKKKLVEEYLGQIKPVIIWDMGANNGFFSRVYSQKVPTISFDLDPVAVEQNYQICKNSKESHILALTQDLSNPSPGIGWEGKERQSLIERGPADAVLALALIHHLAISNNVPLRRIAEFFSKICVSLVLEFVPKDDSQVQRLLSSRKDIFEDYTQKNFEDQFSKYFGIVKSEKIQDSKRTLYLFRSLSPTI